jgi:hypothetical protein
VTDLRVGPAPEPAATTTGALPNLVVIGVMKCGTSALYRYLHSHPDIAMATGQEVNFFVGRDDPPNSDPQSWWQSGQWHRGVDWYASLFDAASPVRGECSPGYTSPSHAEAPGRMAAVLPDVRLICAVRDPFDRAVSQYWHHRRDGSERRDLREAILDPQSQYLSRGRYFDRLAPYLRLFRRDQLHIVVQERLLAERRRELRAVYAHAGADPHWWQEDLERRWHVGGRSAPGTTWLRRRVMDSLNDDVEVLKELMGDALPEWGA